MFYLRGSGLSLLSGSSTSWFNGEIRNSTLYKPVTDARMLLMRFHKNETKVTELRNELENIFSKWKLEHGSQSTLSEFKDKEIDDCPPYACAGNQVTNFAELLEKLRKEAYPPLLALDNEIGNQCVSALLVLSEAANDQFESAIKAYWEIQRYEQESESQNRKTSIMMQEKALPLIRIGHKSITGHQSRDDYQDKQDCQTIAKELWEKDPSKTIKALIDAPELKLYKQKYSGRHTLRGWLSKVDPRPEDKKTGRPSKKLG